MTGTAIAGGCQCGAVRYTLHVPAERLDHCHCSMCRKCHGALFATWSKVRRDKFTVDRGASNLATYDSSPAARRKFCKSCGSPLAIEYPEHPRYLWITAGTLDGGAHPGQPKEKEFHIFVGSKAPWYAITDGLPQHQEF